MLSEPTKFLSALWRYKVKINELSVLPINDIMLADSNNIMMKRLKGLHWFQQSTALEFQRIEISLVEQFH
jgi:hypothetical protein